MWRKIIILLLFLTATIQELAEIISFEKKEKKQKDEEHIKLFRKYHWTLLLLFLAGTIDKLIEIISLGQL